MRYLVPGMPFLISRLPLLLQGRRATRRESDLLRSPRGLGVQRSVYLAHTGTSGAKRGHVFFRPFMLGKKHTVRWYDDL